MRCIFITSPLWSDGWSSVSIRRIIFTFFKYVPLITQLLQLVGRLGSHKPVKLHQLDDGSYSNWLLKVDTQSMCNRSVGWVFVLSLVFHFCWNEDFCHRTGTDLFLFLFLYQVQCQKFCRNKWRHHMNIWHLAKKERYESDKSTKTIRKLRSDYSLIGISVYPWSLIFFLPWFILKRYFAAREWTLIISNCHYRILFDLVQYSTFHTSLSTNLSLSPNTKYKSCNSPD